MTELFDKLVIIESVVTNTDNAEIKQHMFEKYNSIVDEINNMYLTVTQNLTEEKQQVIKQNISHDKNICHKMFLYYLSIMNDDTY